MSAEPAETPKLRKLFLRLLLAFLVATAILALIQIWGGVDERGQILASSATISFASLLGLTGAAQLDRSPRSPLGIVNSPTTCCRPPTSS